MPRDGKQSITVDEVTFEYLSERKHDADTWDDYLKRCARVETPRPDKTNPHDQPPLSEQTELHLKRVQHDGDFEAFWWEYGGMFLVAPKSGAINE